MSKVSAFSELSRFYESDSTNWVSWIFNETLSSVFDNRTKIFKDKRSNCKIDIVEEVKHLLLGIATGVKNVTRLIGTKAGELMRLHKSAVFDGFLNRGDIDWRTFLYKVTAGLMNMKAKEIAGKAGEVFGQDPNVAITEGEGRRTLPKCLIADDTVYPKSGRRSELLGKVFDHNLGKMVLGYKGLNLCYFDGMSTFVADFAMVGEKMDDPEHPQGMRIKDIERRYSTSRDADSEIQKRIEEYSQPKPELLKKMVRGARKNGFGDAEYLPADSWFFSAELLRFIVEDMKMHYIGMAKSSVCFDVAGKNMNTAGLAAYLKKQENQRRRAHGKDADGNAIPKVIKIVYGSRFYGAEITCEYKGRKVKVCIFSGDKKEWNAVVSTDLDLTIKQVFEYRQIRWTIEVFHSDAKELFGPGKCQQRNFCGQITDLTLKMSVYNIMTFTKRITVYETLGGLFGAMTECASEVDLADRILGMVLKSIDSIARECGFSSKSLLEIVLGDNKDINALYNMVKRTESAQAGSKLET